MSSLNGKLYFICDDGKIGRVFSVSEIMIRLPSLYDYLGENVVAIRPKKLLISGDSPRILCDIRFSDATGISEVRWDVPISKFKGAAFIGELPSSKTVIVTYGGLIIPMSAIKQKFGIEGAVMFRENIHLFMNLNHDDSKVLGNMMSALVVLK